MASRPSIARPFDEVSHRAYNGLRRLGVRTLNDLVALDEKTIGATLVGDLAQLSEGQLLATKNFGRGSLREIASLLGAKGLSLDMRLPDWPPPKLAELCRIHAKDIEKQSLVELFPSRKCGLEDELWVLTKPAGSLRNREIAAAYFALDGSGGCTLEAAARKHGLTRERVRQICDRLPNYWNDIRVTPPRLLRAVAAVKSHIPARAERIEQLLVAQSIATAPVRLEAILAAAELLGLQKPFNLVRARTARIAIAPDSEMELRGIYPVARRMVSAYGVANVEDISEEMGRRGDRGSADVIVAVLSEIPSIHWLDDDKTWLTFLLKNDQASRRTTNRLATSIRKVVAVAHEISLPELREAVSRNYKMQGFVPPTAVLRDLCARLPFCRVEEGVVRLRGNFALADVLSPAEVTVVSQLREFGRPVAKSELEAACLARGQNPSTFSATLSNSPAIQHVAFGIYSVRGARFVPATIETVQKRCSETFLDYGWTKDGGLWTTIRASLTTIKAGVFTVPTAARKIAHGMYRLVDAEGLELGWLAASDRGAWKLGSVLQRRGVKPGDTVLIILYPARGEAILHLGASDLLEDLRDSAPLGDHQSAGVRGPLSTRK